MVTASELAAVPQITVKTTAHDQPVTYEGVPIRELLTRAVVPAGEVLRHSTECRRIPVLERDGEPSMDFPFPD